MDHLPSDSAAGQPSRWMDIHLDTSSATDNDTQFSTAHGTEEHAASVSPEGQTSIEPSGRSARRGPKPITDRPTKRFEGKAYPEQIVKLVELETRLTMEAKSIPSAERRRITLNTFVRLGLEVVLAHADNLTGANEDELLESLRRSISSNPAARSSRK